MHKIRHFYYQNKEKIWKVVLIIAFLLGIIYFLNERAANNGDETSGMVSQTDKEIYSDEENKTYISDTSAISGGTVNEYEVQKINNTISKFLQYCKSGNAEEAYNMLSADCKENEYKTIEKFKQKYIQSRFDKESIYEIENWIRDTYKISISKDLLATGNVGNNEKRVEYITIVKEDSQEKLNINSYIGKKELNKETTKNDVKITAVSKRTYMDYEIYDFKIENLSDKTIKVDSFDKTNTMYVEDSNGNKYNAQKHEILESDLEIRTNNEIKISIKYTNNYSLRTDIEQIVFENIILDYIKYEKSENKKAFDEICEIKINI